MFKKICTYTFIFLLTVSIVLGNAETITPENAVITAFEKSQAQFQEVNINSHVILGKFITIDNAEKICNDVAGRLNLSDVKVSLIDEEGLSQIVMHGLIDEEIYTTIIVQSTQYQDLEESTIVLDIIDTKGEYDLRELCDKIRNILSSYGKVTVNITMTGTYNDNLDMNKKKDIVSNIFESINAKKIEGISDENLISVTGHTPKVMEYVSYNNKKVNINVALRYNSFEGKTNIWIGTPLIVTEY